MNCAQHRFYDVMEYFDDDERLAAHALVDIMHIGIDVEVIYKDLLGCHYKKYIDALEKVVQLDIKSYCESKQFELDMKRSSTWSCGDMQVIEHSGWKFLEKDTQK